MRPMNVVLLCGLLACAYGEGFHNGPVTFGSNLDHLDGGKSYSSITLGGTNGGTINTGSIGVSRGASYASGGGGAISVGGPRLSVSRLGGSARYDSGGIYNIQSGAPRISVSQGPSYAIGLQQPGLSVYQSPGLAISGLGGASRYSVGSGASIGISAPRVSYSGPATSHGYTVNAPGLTKTATFGYGAGGGSYSVGAPRVTIRQERPSLISVSQPQIRVQQRPAIIGLSAPAPQIRITQANPSLSVTGGYGYSGPATSHGYTVNAPGLTNTATFGYSGGAVGYSGPRYAVSQPNLNLRVSQPRINLQVARPEFRVTQAAPRIQLSIPQTTVRVNQAGPRVAYSGPATSHGYTVNAPGLTKTATFGYGAGNIGITQAAPRFTVAQSPRYQVRVPQQNIRIAAPAPRIDVLQGPRVDFRVAQPRISVRTQQPRISYSGPATSHGYTVNAPGLTKTATFGYGGGYSGNYAGDYGISGQVTGPRIAVSQPNYNLRVAQPGFNVQVARPQIRVQQQAPRIQLSIPQTNVRVHSNAPRVSYSGPAVSHGYTVNAPGLTKTATFGYGGGAGSYGISQAAPRITVSEAPRYQVRVPQQNIRIQAPAPQISVLQAPAPRVEFLQGPRVNLRLAQPGISVRTEQPRISYSGPATSHGYTVNAPGLTKTATFGYGGGAIGFTQDAPRIQVSQPRIQVTQPQIRLSAPDPQVSVFQAPAPRVDFLQGPAPRVEVYQAPAPRVEFLESPRVNLRVQQPSIQVRTEQPRISYSGPATSHGYTVNAPGLTKTATFGYGAGAGYNSGAISVSRPGVSAISYGEPSISVHQAPISTYGFRYASPQIAVHSVEPQIQVVQREFAPQITQFSGFQGPQVRTQSFDTASHGYTVNAPGFTKHKTFAGPAVYGTNQAFSHATGSIHSKAKSSS